MSTNRSSGLKSGQRGSISQLAKMLYGEAFEATSREGVSAAMEDWKSLRPWERSFISSHLVYLNLQQLAANSSKVNRLIKTMDDLCDTAEDIAEELMGSDEPETFVDDDWHEGEILKALPSEEGERVSVNNVELSSRILRNLPDEDGGDREAAVLQRTSNESLTGVALERTGAYAGHDEGGVYIALDTTTTSASELHELQGQEGLSHESVR